MENMYDKIQEAVEAIKTKVSSVPEVGLVLGSGLGAFAESIEREAVIPYNELPHFKQSTVKGHAGNLVFGKTGGKNVVIQQGRYHYYEGHTMKECTFPIRVMKALGIKLLVLTNAAGGLNRNFEVGDLMLMTDHINFMGDNPLTGANDERLGTRFPSLHGLYNKDLQAKAEQIGWEIKLRVQRGVYLAVMGPSYETMSETRFMRSLGADAVGMSTVPEAIVAQHGGVERILGISCITNKIPEGGHVEVCHEEVMETSNRVGPLFVDLLKRLVAEA